MKKFKFIIFLMMLLLLSLQIPIFAAKKTTTVRGNKTKSAIDYSELAKKVLPSLVRITTDKYAGSGFFVSSNGDILTNYHVIEETKNITVLYSNNKHVYASVKGIDIDGDMALLSINVNKTVPFLKISNMLPEQGEEIMAVGNPKGLEGTISNGIISAFRENNRWIQFTAPVSEGSSGGALINSKGEVVGMPTLLFRDGQNLNFAISAPVLNKFFEAVKNNTPYNISQIGSKNSSSINNEEWDKLWNGEKDFISHDIYYDLNPWTIYNDYPMH